jgi:hypothetical protein
MNGDFWTGAVVGAVIGAVGKWFFDYLRTLLERKALLVVSVHRAFPNLAPPECYFIRLVNHTPDRELEVKDVWFEGSPAVSVINPQRPLPARLRAGTMWETWIPIANVPSAGNDAFTRARVKLSTGEVIGSRKTPDNDLAPGVGQIAGA